MNLITGFHLFDEEQHLFILEGRKEEAIDILYRQLPKPPEHGKITLLFQRERHIPPRSDVEVLYDSSIHFNERLYIRLGADLTHIKLCRALGEIISQPLIFIRDNLAKETFDALDRLNQVRSSSSEKNALRPIPVIIFSSFTPID